MEPIYQSIRKRARQIASRSPSPKFYQDYSTPTLLSKNIFRSDPMIRQLRTQITRQLENDFGHGLKHAVKVALDIGILMIVEGYRSGHSDAYTQRRVVLAQCAALLHDIERKQHEHARIGSDTANRILDRYPFEPDEIEDIILAIRNHEAFKSTVELTRAEGTLLSDCLYDADKFRWGPDNFTDTVWRMVSFSKTPFDKFIQYYPKGMKNLEKIKDTFRTDTGKHYGPQFIDLGIQIGEELYEVILDEFSESKTSIGYQIKRSKEYTMKDVVIVSACRTAIGTFGGTLKDSHAATIASITMKEAVKRAGIDPAIIDDVRYGCNMEPADSLNVARVGALLAGIPDHVTAATINRVCISGMEAVLSGMAMIQAGMADIILAGGVEHMSGVPYSVPAARWGCKLQHQVFVDSLIHALHCGSHILPHPEDGPVNAEEPPLSLFKGKPYIMGHTAEFVAQYLDISRDEMDQVALRSHQNAERATNEGDFREEIVPIEIPQRKIPSILFDKDEHFRPGLTIEKLQSLPPAFIPKTGKVTAGNSSGINDGSAGLIIMSAEKAEEVSATPMARIKAVGRGGCHPSIMGLSPVPAVNALLDSSGLKIEDFERIEINEAFAAQYIGCERELGFNRDITNVNGSGIGLGHPVGATGARIMVTLIHTLKREGKTLGLATLCGGGGVSMACALEML